MELLLIVVGDISSFFNIPAIKSEDLGALNKILAAARNANRAAPTSAPLSPRLRYGFHAQLRGDIDHGCNNSQIALSLLHLRHKAFVDFQRCHRQILQIRHRRVSGSKINDGKAASESLHIVQHTLEISTSFIRALSVNSMVNERR